MRANASVLTIDSHLGKRYCCNQKILQTTRTQQIFLQEIMVITKGRLVFHHFADTERNIVVGEICISRKFHIKRGNEYSPCRIQCYREADEVTASTWKLYHMSMV